MTTLELKNLKMVRTIARTGNLTKATKMLHVSQPALSRQLLDLEDRLGARLFNRTGRNMVLTDIGEDILQVADDVLERIERTEKAIGNKISGKTGELKIGVHCIFCFKWLPGAISEFRERFPNVTVEINSSVNYIEDLEKKKCDIIITPFPVSNDRVHYEPLFSDELVVITAPDQFREKHSGFKPEDFSDLSYLSFTDRENDAFCSLWLKPEGVEPKRYMVINQTDALIQLVKSGLGVAIFPKWSVKDLAVKGEIGMFAIDDERLKGEWYAASLKHRFQLEFQNRFISLIRRHAFDLFT